MHTASRVVARRFLLSVLVVLGALLVLHPALAQTGGTGSINGTITDPSGSVVPNATVTAVNTSTGVKTSATSTSSGYFVLPLLRPGTYTVTVAASGFSTLNQQNVVVDALASVALSPQLALGAATETVTVTDLPPLLASEDVKLGSNIENDTYDALPLAMNQSARDPTAFAGLAVGVNSFNVQAAGPSTASYNGGQPYQNETYVEGLPMTSAGTESDTRNLAFGISVEAVNQFQVATSGSEAMYEGQGVQNYIIKTGGAKFHGSAFEYFRNTLFDSKPFFASFVPVEHQNEFGGSLGGPIIREKLFFFANYDGYRYSSVIPQSGPVLQNIPTLAERNGDFSAEKFPIYDPTTCLQTNSAGACIKRQQFSYNGVLNVIPPSRISKVSQSFQSYLPAPTNNGLTLNYLASLPNQVTNDSGTLKIEYAMSDRNRLFGVYSRGKYANPIVGSLAQPTATTNAALPIPYLQGRSVIEYATLVQLHDSYTITPSVLNDLSYGVNRLYIPLTSNTANGNYPSKAGLTGLPPGIASTGFPDITFNGNNFPVNWGGTNAHVNTEAQTSFTVQDNVLWTKGRHHATFGFQWQALQDNFNNPTTGSLAGFTFSTSETSNFVGSGANAASLDTGTGLPYASYLLGAVNSSTVTQNAVAETGGRYKTYAAYAQDNIQVTPKLTFTAGLRWDVWTPFTEVYNRQSFFNPNLPNPVAGNRLGALQFAGHGAYSCGCNTPVNTHYNNYGPRFGLAYKLTNNDVIRASYGMFYAHAGGVGGRVNGRQGLSQIGFNSTGTQNSTVTGQPAYYWEGGVPGNSIAPPFFNPSYGIGFILPTAPGAAAIGAGVGTAQTLVYGDPDRGARPPQYQDFALNLQHAFSADMILSVAYSGSVGRYLPGASVFGQFTNQIPLQYLPLGSLLGLPYNTTNVNAAAGLGFQVPLPFPNFSGSIGQALKPYPQYNSLSNPWLDVGKSSYNSLQTTFNRRMAKGLSFMINYTFSKEMDDLGTSRLPGANYLEYSLGAINHKHVLATTVVYKLPFGAGHTLNGGSPAARALISGWQLSGLFTGSTGAPLTVTGTCTGGGIIDATCYPNVVKGASAWVPNAPEPGTAAVAFGTAYINAAAFTNPPAYTYGNAARTAPLGLFAPTIRDLDVSIRREIPLYERVKFLFQADVFNTTNSVYFNAPNTTLGNSAFGRFASQANQARKWQFVGRVTF